MPAWLVQIDRLLRGDFTSPETLQTGRIPIPISTLLLTSLGLGAFYGICMGFFRATMGVDGSWLPLLITPIKVPLVFLLTLFVAFPSLYVFAALHGSKLQLIDMLRLLSVAIAMNLALLASFGPVTVFFALCTSSYAFMKLINVVFFGISGLIGLGTLYQALQFVFQPTKPDPSPAPVAAPATTTTAPEAPLTHITAGRRAPDPNLGVRRIMTIWLVIYAVVGAQMGWVLRPFIGSPDLPYALFRERDSNFFQNVLESLSGLLN